MYCRFNSYFTFIANYWKTFFNLSFLLVKEGWALKVAYQFAIRGLIWHKEFKKFPFFKRSEINLVLNILSSENLFLSHRILNMVYFDLFHGKNVLRDKNEIKVTKWYSGRYIFASLQSFIFALWKDKIISIVLERRSL